uniref:G_PROTEIN_RECEP_F1_2 domain-containing protein n=1 Tax=Steinernema glaseri TaxID=37863 RepID=A0A1I7YJE5_9BILA
MSSLSTGCAVFFMSCIGLIVHYAIFHKVVFKGLFGKIFGSLWLSREVAYLIQKCGLICCVAPGLIIYGDMDNAPVPIKWFSQLIILFAYVSIFSNFLIAANRCCIVYFPLKYKRIFSKERTRCLVLIFWALAVFPTVPSFVQQPKYIRTLCGASRELLDLSVATTSYAITFVVDVFTYRKVLIVLKIVAQQLVSIMCVAIFNTTYFFASVWPRREHFALIGWTASSVLDGIVVVLFTPNFFDHRHLLATTSKNTLKNVSKNIPEK